MENLVGKTFKSKINGDLFYVEDLKIDGLREYYIILCKPNNREVRADKDWFENGIMKNLEEINND